MTSWHFHAVIEGFLRQLNRIIIAVCFSLIFGSPSSALDNVDKLIAIAFECTNKPKDGGAQTRRWSKFEYLGDQRRFILNIVTLAGDTELYSETTQEYWSFLYLLKFTHDKSTLTISCRKPSCLARRAYDSGCYAQGGCANVSVNSVRITYSSALRLELCDPSAAADASDGLNIKANDALPTLIKPNLAAPSDAAHDKMR